MLGCILVLILGRSLCLYLKAEDKSFTLMHIALLHTCCLKRNIAQSFSPARPSYPRSSRGTLFELLKDMRKAHEDFVKVYRSSHTTT